MIAAALVVCAFVVVLLRRKRKTTLAGLDATKPTFTLTPPTRYTTRLRDHRL